MSTDLYLDYNGSTPVDPEVARAYTEHLRHAFGNAAAAHPEGAKARATLESARNAVAEGIGAQASEIVFTSGGTESNNWALIGTAHRALGGHLIVSAIEHKSVLRSAEHLERNGYSVTRLPVSRGGAVSLEDLRSALRDDTFLVSVMLANNETGVMQPVEEIGALCRQRSIAFHCDAVCAVGKVEVDVRRIGCDLLSLSSHKLYAPKGSGALFVRSGFAIDPYIHGCGQENGLRSGSVNTSGAVAFGRAFERMRQGAFSGRVHVEQLRDALWDGISARFANARRNGEPPFLPNTLNVAFEGCDGRELQAALGEAGISVATGAAASGAAPSHVLLAMGYSPERAQSSLRFSLGAESVPASVEACLSALELALERAAVRTGA